MSKELSRLLKRLRRDFPAAKVLSVSARTGDGMEDWFRLLLDDESSPERVMDVDYARYGVGEALLGWYNARLQWDGIKNGVLRMDSNMVLVEIARKIQKRLERQGVEIAHFKMSLKTQAGVELTVVNAVRNGSPAEVSSRMTKPVTMGEILINLRAEGAPELLEAAVRREIEGLPVTWLESVAFRPGQPRPVHRISARANT